MYPTLVHLHDLFLDFWNIVSGIFYLRPVLEWVFLHSVYVSVYVSVPVPVSLLLSSSQECCGKRSTGRRRDRQDSKKTGGRYRSSTQACPGSNPRASITAHRLTSPTRDGLSYSCANSRKSQS